MDRIEAVERARLCLEDYLHQKGIDTRKNFHCLSPTHNDQKPSMNIFKDKKHIGCFACNAYMDIFDLVEIDLGITDFNEKLNYICNMFGIDYNPSSNNQFKRRRRIVPLSSEESSLIGLNWRDTKKIAYTCRNLSYEKPEERRLPKEGDLYVVGELINGSSLWFDLQKDTEAYEWMVRQKCREKIQIILESINYCEMMMEKEPQNLFYKELREGFESLREQVMDIYIRFHGRVTYIRKTG